MKPIVVPTSDNLSIRNELTLNMLIEKLILGLRGYMSKNSNVRAADFGFDEDIQLIFFSEAFGNAAGIHEALAKEMNSYKQNVFNKLLDYSKTWSTDHEFMFNSILQEKFAMANMVKFANLEIERTKEASNLRLEAYKEIKERNKQLQGQVSEVERVFSSISKEARNERFSSEFSKLESTISTMKTVLVSNSATLNLEEPIKYLGDIHGDQEGFLRLQSAFRELERENEVLR